MDWAHDWTDQQIAELTARMQTAYDEAAKEMSKKLADFLSEYDERNKDMKAKLSSGEIDQDAYQRWLEFQSQRQVWLQDMSATLAADATRVDQLAIDYVNEMVPEVYAQNYNYQCYRIDSEIGLFTPSFTLYDQKTVGLMVADPDMMRLPKAKHVPADDSVWNMRKINEAITQGILQGESIPNMSKRLRSVLGMDMRAAVRTARTVMTSAETAGRVESYRVADKAGVKVQKQWISTIDLRTRPSHRKMNKVHVPYDQPFVVGPNSAKMMHPADPKGPAGEVYNCFLGDTLVATDSRIIRSYRHLYVGETVTVQTASGVEFTCTPNHPILTPDGWVAAKFLNQGDRVCVAGIGRSLGGRNPDVDHVMTSMETVHELLSMLAIKRTRALGVDFHGDVPTSNVEIVGEERLLREDWNSCLGEGITELLLEDTDSPYLRLSPLMEGFGRVMGATASDLSSKGVLLAFLEGHIAHPDFHGFGATSTLNASISEHAGNDVSGMADSLGDGLLGLPSEVGIDHIVNVEVNYTRGSHVYNLQTANGRYFVNSKDNGNAIIAHNCRCTLVGWVQGIEAEDPEQWQRLPEGTTYEQWMGAKQNDQSKQNGQSKQGNGAQNVGKDLGRLRKNLSDAEGELNAARSVAKPYRGSEEYYKQASEKYKAERDALKHVLGYDKDALQSESMSVEKEMDRLANLLWGDNALKWGSPEHDRADTKYWELNNRANELIDMLQEIRDYKSKDERYRECLQLYEEAKRSNAAGVKAYEEAQARIPSLTRKRNAALRELSDAVPFGDAIADKVGRSFIAGLEQTIENAKARHPEIADAFRMFHVKFKVVDAEHAKGAFYRSSEGGVHFNADSDSKGNPSSSPFRTIVHEFGHLIDNLSMSHGYEYWSATEEFEKAIRGDWTRFRNAMGKEDGVTRNKNDHAIQRLREEASELDRLEPMLGNKTYSRVSDIIEGCTKTPYPLGWGHGASYHKNMRTSTCTEFVAEYFDSALTDEAAHEQMRRIFPTACAMVDDFVRELLS